MVTRNLKFFGLLMLSIACGRFSNRNNNSTAQLPLTPSSKDVLTENTDFQNCLFSFEDFNKTKECMDQFVIADPFTMPYLLNNTVGNGGDVLICHQPDGATSVNLLDYVEARLRYKLAVDFGQPFQTVEEAIKLVTSRLQNFDNQLASQIELESQTFFKNVNFVENTRLVDIPDSFHIALPANCKLEQIAIQNVDHLPHERYYTISKSLWDRLSTEDQAGLVLHEIIYKLAIENGHKNSIKSRYLNSVISSDWLSTTSQNEFYEVLGAASFPWVYHSIPFEPKSLEIDQFEGKEFYKGTLYKDYFFATTLIDDGIMVPVGSSIEIYKNGQIKSFYVEEHNWINVEKSKSCQIFVHRKSQVNFYPSGNILSIINKSNEERDPWNTYGETCYKTAVSNLEIVYAPFPLDPENLVQIEFFDSKLAIPKSGFTTKTDIILNIWEKPDSIASGSLEADGYNPAFQFPVAQNQLVNVCHEEKITLHPNGLLREAVICPQSKTIQRENADGSQSDYDFGDRLKFDDSGRVLEKIENVTTGYPAKLKAYWRLK